MRHSLFDMASVRSAAPATQQHERGVRGIPRRVSTCCSAVVADSDNIVIGPEAFYLNSYGYEGFGLDLVSDYRVLSVTRTRPGAAFFISRPARGTYYPAFIMYDEQGVADQVVSLFVGNERTGVAVAAAHDNRSYLYVLSQPCEFTGTALITLMTPDSAAGADSGGGSYRIENLLLLKEKPRQEPRRYGFSSVRAVPFERAGRRQARITWITDWATRSRLEYGPSTQYGSRVETEEVLHCRPPRRPMRKCTCRRLRRSTTIIASSWTACRRIGPITSGCWGRRRTVTRWRRRTIPSRPHRSAACEGRWSADPCRSRWPTTRRWNGKVGR